MTTKEIEIQRALGTLPYAEWMKLQGIILQNKWWHFPLPEKYQCLDHKLIVINKINHYPVHAAYIIDLHHSMTYHHPVEIRTEEELAREIIAQCYSCMGMETIDH